MKQAISLLLAGTLALCLLSGCSISFGNQSNSQGAAAPADEGAAADSIAAPAATAETASGAGKAASYAEAYTRAMDIRTAVVDLMSERNDKYNESLPEDDFGTEMLMYEMMFLSINMAFTATFSEDAESIAGVKGALGFLGVDDGDVQRVGANDYTISYTGNEGDKMVLNARFDPATGSLCYLETKNGAPDYFFEFVDLGGGKYAYQTEYERAYVEYSGNNLARFAYTAVADAGYDSEADSIYPNGAGADEAWVMQGGSEQYEQVYQFDGSTLKMDAVPMMGDRVTVEL